MKVRRLSCNYAFDDIELVGAPDALLAFADALQSAVQEIELPDSCASDLYPCNVKTINVSTAEISPRFSCEGEVFLVVSGLQRLADAAEMIRSLVKSPGGSGRHLHLEPGLNNSILDNGSWELVVVVE
jgi:hypothetical protein